MAAKNLKMQKIPCVFAENLTGQQRRAYIIADNKLTELAAWDNDKLKIELQELTELNFDISLTGFDDKDFDFKIDLGFDENNAEASELDEIGEISEENQRKIKPGDIYILGNHKLICGDCTNQKDLKRLLQDKKIDLIFTDPPYGMKKEKDGVKNDNLNSNDLLKFNEKWILKSFENLKDNGSFYICGVDQPLMDIYSNILKPLILDNRATFRNLLTWYKGSGRGQNSGDLKKYAVADEKILFFSKGVAGFNDNKDFYFQGFEPIRQYIEEQVKKCGWSTAKMKTIAGHKDKNRDHWTSKSQFNLVTEDVYEKFKKWAKENKKDAFKKPYEEIKKEYEEIKKDFEKERIYFDNTHDNMNSVWTFYPTQGEEREDAGGHPTPKPVKLCERAILTSSREGENVFDAFGGSGSTLIACENTGRNCYICEIEPRWCNVIIDRWEKMSGKVAFKAE